MGDRAPNRYVRADAIGANSVSAVHVSIVASSVGRGDRRRSGTHRNLLAHGGAAQLMFSPRTRPHRQRGIVLLVSLALLTALAVGGLAAAQTTTLELRMARNQHDAALALHAAEVALSAAEAWLQANADPAGPATLFAAGGNGLHEAVGYDQVAPWRDASAWAGAQVLANVVPDASAQPRYLVEWLGTRIDTAAWSIRSPRSLSTPSASPRAAPATAPGPPCKPPTACRAAGAGEPSRAGCLGWKSTAWAYKLAGTGE